MISVNIHEAKSKLSALLRVVEEKGERIRICRNGKLIAELRPAKKVVDHLTPDPRLKGILHEDPSLPMDREDWPEAWLD